MSKASPRRASAASLPGPFKLSYLAPRHWMTWLAVGLLYLIYLLPTSVRLALGSWIGDQIYRRHHKRRAIVETNLRLCFPDRSEQEREALARNFFRQFIQCQLGYSLLWWGGERALRNHIRLEGDDHVRPHVEAGRPVILLTCHHAAMDVAGLEASRHYPKVLSVVKSLRNPILSWMLMRGRVRSGGVVFERSEQILPWVRMVRDGYLFFYSPDEDLGPEKSVFAPLFGVPAATLTATAKLARMCNAVVVPYMAYHHNGKYVAKFFPPLKDYPSGDDVADATAMNAAIERMVREAPEQYFWSLRLFQTRPEGERCPYEMKHLQGK